MAEIQLKSTIAVEYVQHCGSDEMIAHAAWVSTKGAMALFGEGGNPKPDKVRGILKFLIQHRHGTPFEHGSLTVRVHAPIKVWREWHRHRVGMALHEEGLDFSFNEESGRYKDLEPIFWVPPRDRPMIRPEGFKSSKPVFRVATDEEYRDIAACLRLGYDETYHRYLEMLSIGTDRGLARDVLGVGIFSACYVTCNPRSLMHFLELRSEVLAATRPSSPLWEIANAAQQLEAIFVQHWPMTHELWNKHGRMAP